MRQLRLPELAGEVTIAEAEWFLQWRGPYNVRGGVQIMPLSCVELREMLIATEFVGEVWGLYLHQMARLL